MLQIVVDGVQRAVARVDHVAGTVQFQQRELGQFNHRRRLSAGQQIAQRPNGFLDALGVVAHGVVIDVIRALDGFAQDMFVKLANPGVAAVLDALPRRRPAVFRRRGHADDFHEQAAVQDVVVIGSFQRQAHEPVFVQAAQIIAELIAADARLGGLGRGGGWLWVRRGNRRVSAALGATPGRRRRSVCKNFLAAGGAVAGVVKLAALVPEFDPIGAAAADLGDGAIRTGLELADAVFSEIFLARGRRLSARRVAGGGDGRGSFPKAGTA